MSQSAIDTRELDAMIRQLDSMPTILGAEMGAAARMGGEELRDFVADYPGETDANRPPAPYYQRGLGTVGVNRTYPTSENLGKSWVVKTAQAIGRWTATLTAGASYAHWVQSKAQQVAKHRATGWPTDEEAIDKKESKIRRIVQRGVDRALARIARM